MERRKHIVHVVVSFGCGGLERVIANLINNSDALTHKHTVISLTNDLSFSYALPDHVTLLSLDKPPGNSVATHFKLARRLYALNPDVLHTYNFATLEYHLVALMVGVKRRVHCDHGLGGDHPAGTDRLHNRFRCLISRLIHHYVVVSEDLRRWVVDEVGVCYNKVHFVFNGVPVPPKTALPAKAPGMLNMVIVGRLHPVKNHIRLLNAMAMAMQASPQRKITLTIVGDGAQYEHIIAHIATLGLADNVSMAGHQDDVSGFIRRSDVFVLSSDYEAMPMTVLEAMALCRPVICPRVGGVDDFITSEDVFLIPGKDEQALAAMIGHLADISSCEYAEKVSRAYDKVASCYSVGQMVSQYNLLYD